ncbi:MAG TPA: DUF2934 domain-containing protein [Steroidobacteraceae bacterium]|nr:DUF2934 domain-containing protein [Steroidobacteraceae bacterium]
MKAARRKSARGAAQPGAAQPDPRPAEAHSEGTVSFVQLAGREAMEAAAELDISTLIYSDHGCTTRDELIRKAAYLRAERRGFAPGGQVDDWLAAEHAVDQWIAIHGLPECLIRGEALS